MVESKQASQDRRHLASDYLAIVPSPWSNMPLALSLSYVMRVAAMLTKRYPLQFPLLLLQTHSSVSGASDVCCCFNSHIMDTVIIHRAHMALLRAYSIVQ